MNRRLAVLGLVLMLAGCAGAVALVQQASSSASVTTTIAPTSSTSAVPQSTPSASSSVLEAPSGTVAPTSATNGAVWMSGQELMDGLSAAYGYVWATAGDGSTAFDADGVRVMPPIDGSATVAVPVPLGTPDADPARIARRVASVLAPDVVRWLDDAIAEGIALGRAYSTSARTQGGGQVIVTLVDERDLRDWMYVRFLPHPLTIRDPAPAGSGAVAYLQSGAVWLVDSNGTAAGRLLVAGSTAYGVRDLLGWSPDGLQLFYQDGGGDLWVTDAGWKSATRLGGPGGGGLCPAKVAADNCQAYVDEAAVSPDGRRIAYPLLEGRELQISTIAVFDMTTSTTTRLGSTRADASHRACTARTGTNGGVQWSPDGTRLVFEREGMGPKVKGQCQVTVFTIDADGTDLRRLVGPDVQAHGPQWSPDGSRIAFSVAKDLYTVRPDGANVTRLTSDGASARPSWTSDGRIVFIRWTMPDAVVGDLWVMDADGGSPTRLEATVPALTAARCDVCTQPDSQGRVFANHHVNAWFWQPDPESAR